MATCLKNALLACLLVSPLLLQAQVYKQTDEQGNVTFTDQPTEQAEPVTVPEANTAPPVEIKPRQEPTNSEAVTAAPYQNLKITDPKDNSIIPSRSGNFAVQLQLLPALEEGHQIQLLLNNTVYQSGSQTRFELTSVRRGSHNLLAQVIDKDGSVQIRSNAITVQVYRPSSK